jgi:hypothetical protein
LYFSQGQFLASYPFREDIFAATKYCVFHPMTVTREAVRSNVAERCRRLQTQRIDLLQFHWQFVSPDAENRCIVACRALTMGVDTVRRSSIPRCSPISCRRRASACCRTVQLRHAAHGEGAGSWCEDTLEPSPGRIPPATIECGYAN